MGGGIRVGRIHRGEKWHEVRCIAKHQIRDEEVSGEYGSRKPIDIILVQASLFSSAQSLSGCLRGILLSSG